MPREAGQFTSSSGAERKSANAVVCGHEGGTFGSNNLRFLAALPVALSFGPILDFQPYTVAVDLGTTTALANPS